MCQGVWLASVVPNTFGQSSVCLPSGQLCLSSPRPSTPPSKVKSPVWSWKVQGRLQTWSRAWWRWRTLWRHPWSRRSWYASYPARCPGCLRKRLRVGSNGWAVGGFWGWEESSQVHGEGGCLKCPNTLELLLFYTCSVTPKRLSGPNQVSCWTMKLTWVK